MANRECDPGEEVFVEMEWRRKDGQVTFERSGMEGAPDWVQEADRRLRGRLAERLGAYAVEGRGRSTPAEAQVQGGGEAVAWMRRWAFYKVGVMALPKKERPRGWQLLPVTPTNALDDDVPLYAAPPSVPVGVEDLSCCGGNDETPKSHCMDCSRYPGLLARQPAPAPVAGDAAEVIEEMRSRMSSRGRVGDGPVYGGELIDWANRLEAALAAQQQENGND